ncbi:DNA gyrase inhibitor YacG [Pseudothauera nasutitermitis]|uniref:DNA gyrase inhibitor YacG n=1 Tax=Pseudothauera nasutitermitis TaxID=2565930 RepID=A0A4V3WBM9_9RHOO|nr:DNA gyrase inhibitor YacG [Pseudothauera nasutitermitis]THF63833.1 DNA gyrase inhibitor YacG [Pseudothauera nasutitermitis]
MPEPRTPRTVKCPNCGKAIEWKTENRFRPFCSERCRQIDLGAWASESYRVAAEAPPDDDEGRS